MRLDGVEDLCRMNRVVNTEIEDLLTELLGLLDVRTKPGLFDNIAI